jgi:two-component system NarL family sensor kinase
VGRRLVAWSLWLATIGACAAATVVALVVTRPFNVGALTSGAAFALAFPLGYATVGLVLALRRSANPIGWLYAAAGLIWSLTMPFQPWVDQLLRTHRPLPLAAQVAVVVRDFSWAPAIALGITLPALLVPDGKLRSRRWRVVAAASVTGAVLAPVAGSIMPGRLLQTPIDNPFGLGGSPGAVAATFAYVGAALHWGSLLAAVVGVVLRFRDSQGIERQQLRWIAAGAITAGIGLLLGGFTPAFVAYFAVLVVPATVAVAVLRYRLYDLDNLISRTVVYGLLTVAGIAVYVGLVKLSEWLLREGAGLGGSLLATAVIAVGFAPARDYLQRLVDRRLYGDRHNPVQAMVRLGERLRDAPGGAPGGDVLAGVLQAVREALRLPWASLRVEEGAEVAAVGRPVTGGELIRLEHEGRRIGALLVGVRSGEDALGGADRQVLGILAAPVAVALHAVLLSQELQRSRERLVAAREEERRRLRRDLHDGLGPVLTAVTLKADAARSALDTAPDRTNALLAELRGDAKQAISDLRRVVYNLRPAALDELGLLGALGEQVDRFGRQGLSISLHAPPTLPVLPAAVEVAAYRIITEALTNIARHAHAHQVTITVAIDGDLCLAVQDDGTTSTANGDGWRPGTGLQSMNERIAEVGGTLEVGPTSTGGRVQASLPLGLA